MSRLEERKRGVGREDRESKGVGEEMMSTTMNILIEGEIGRETEDCESVEV